MSRFFVYFELLNSTCTDYTCFSQVGKFDVPEAIFFDNANINFQQKLIEGAIISDLSKQSANDYFSKIASQNNHLLKITLLDFLNQRLAFPCIQAYLTSFIFDNELNKEKLDLDKAIINVKINNNSDFDFTIFQQDAIFQLIK